MYFRFVAAVVAVVAISAVGIALEKRNLELRRVISQQEYQHDLLVERRARSRSATEQLGAPPRLLAELEAGRIRMQQSEQPIPRRTKAKGAARGSP